MSHRDSKKKRSPNWTDKEVNVLLDLWKEYKKQLENSKRNPSLYQEMSTEMAGCYCYRSAEEIRTKIDNMSKRFKYERTQEVHKGIKSEWRFYWQVGDILGLNPNCIDYVKDNIYKKTEKTAKDPKIEEEEEEFEKTDEKEVMEQEQSQMPDDPARENCLSPLPLPETIYENDAVNEKFFKEVLQEYRETKESLVETDKKIIELLTNQNDLIRTQNELCLTQNDILKTLLQKMT